MSCFSDVKPGVAEVSGENPEWKILGSNKRFASLARQPREEVVTLRSRRENVVLI